MAKPPNVLLHLSNDAENVMLVRQALSGVAEQLELEAGTINDVRTAATEACNNVSLHAYGGEKGPLEVEIRCAPLALEVVVRDHGTGIRPRIRQESESALGIGLAIIKALARRVEFNDPPGGGTEVRMEFPAPPGPSFETGGVQCLDPAAPAGGELTSTVAVAIAPSRLARSVLPRVLSVLAARANFTTDRIADIQLLADALASGATGADSNDEVRLRARVARHRIELAVGPLPDGAARALAESSSSDGAGWLIDRLSDEQWIDGSPGTPEATLVLALAARR